MIKDTLIKFHNDLTGFNPNQPIVLTWDGKDLIYRQYNKVVYVPYLLPLIIVPKKFKLGILTPRSIDKLLDTLVGLIQDPMMSTGDIPIAPGELSITGYTHFKNSTLVGAQVKYQIQLVSIVNKLLCKLILTTFSEDTKLMWKLLKSEKNLPKTKS